MGGPQDVLITAAFTGLLHKGRASPHCPVGGSRYLQMPFLILECCNVYNAKLGLYVVWKLHVMKVQAIFRVQLLLTNAQAYKQYLRGLCILGF